MVKKWFWILTILILVLSAFILNFSFVRVIGCSMEPTLQSNDILFVFKTNDNIIAKTLDKCFQPKDESLRGKVIVFSSNKIARNNEKKYLVKRCLAIPNDSLKIERNLVFINSVFRLDLSIRQHSQTRIRDTCDLHPFVLDIKLTDGYVFVLGDNYGLSNNSRNFGPINHSAIVGVALFIIQKGRIKGLTNPYLWQASGQPHI